MDTELPEKMMQVDGIRTILRCILTGFTLPPEIRELLSKLDDALTSAQQFHALLLANLNGQTPVDVATLKRMVDDWISLSIEAYQSGITCFQAQARESSDPFSKAVNSFVIRSLQDEICDFTKLREAIRTNGAGEPANTT